MSLRQGMRSLARSVMGSKALPTRGGGGGPVQFTDAPKKPVSGMWAQFWWSGPPLPGSGVACSSTRPHARGPPLLARHAGCCIVSAGPAQLAALAPLWPRLQLPLWDEMWWDDGLKHSQPVLDGVGEKTLHSPVRHEGLSRAAAQRPSPASLPHCSLHPQPGVAWSTGILAGHAQQHVLAVHTGVLILWRAHLTPPTSARSMPLYRRALSSSWALPSLWWVPPSTQHSLPGTLPSRYM